MSAYYYAVCDEFTNHLGVFDSMEEAEAFAIDEFNIHRAPSGYFILTEAELNSHKVYDAPMNETEAYLLSKQRENDYYD